MTSSTAPVFHNFDDLLTELIESGALTYQDKAKKLLSQIDIIARDPDGIDFLYNKSLELESSGFFKDTPWENTGRLVPSLVRGTILFGHPNADYEIMSELRLLAYYKQDKTPKDFTKSELESFLAELLVLNLDFALHSPSAEANSQMQTKDIQKAQHLFAFLLDQLDTSLIKEMILEELQMMCAQRPVVVRKIIEIIRLTKKGFTFNKNIETDKEISVYLDAIYNPAPLTVIQPEEDAYSEALKKAHKTELEREARQLGHYMTQTGLASSYLGQFLIFCCENTPEIIPLALGLSENGQAEWETHKEKVIELILETIRPGHPQSAYGLACILNRNLLSREPVKSGLKNMSKVELHPDVSGRIIKSMVNPPKDMTALQYLTGATLRVLGQPLGIGQGNNPTCQSARGISIWSQHAPAKLINYIITVAQSNNLVMRFENYELSSSELIKGLVDQLDYNLDAVSVTLVPHLDKIYNEMMRLASVRGEDPHKWVNPAMYGQWVQVDFMSVYDTLTNSIADFKKFVRTFYAAFHPEYNNDRIMVYPNPVGIFITSSHGEMVGFHAISLLRIEHDPRSRTLRAYFVNPNNEGRQDWGQGIKPSVYGHGELAGESSLPVHQFTARIYAFHYNKLDTLPNLEQVSDAEIEKVEKLARESWGKAYIWL